MPTTWHENACHVHPQQLVVIRGQKRCNGHIAISTPLTGGRTGECTPRRIICVISHHFCTQADNTDCLPVLHPRDHRTCRCCSIGTEERWGAAAGVRMRLQHARDLRSVTAIRGFGGCPQHTTSCFDPGPVSTCVTKRYRLRDVASPRPSVGGGCCD